METILDLVRKSESTKNIWREDYNSTEWKNANKLNILLYGISLNQKPKCSCLEDLFFMLKSKNINQKFNDKMEQQFKIKKGKLISSFKFGFHLSEQSNDSQIKEALKLDPSLIIHFDSYPSDWKVLIGLEEEKPKEMVKEVKKPRAKKVVNGKA